MVATTPDSLPPITADQVAATLSDYRQAAPLVQCLTNTVVTNFTANVLLASGAAPAMVDNTHEAQLFATIASGVLVNTGTPYDETAAAMREAVLGCQQAGTPWVLDPVAAGGLPWRTQLARDLVALHAPRIIRGNASEISGLAGGAGGRGVDATDSPEAMLEVARDLARQGGSTVAISGPVDHLTDGQRVVTIGNGHPLMTQVTGVGCSLGALMAGFAAVTPDALLAATTATGLLTVAADRAARSCHGPGSFAVGLLDAVSQVTPQELADQIRLG